MSGTGGGGSGSGSGDEFGRAVARAAVAQALEAAGFDCAHRSAVDAVVDIVLRYITHLGGPPPSTPTSPAARSPMSSTSSRRSRRAG